ncbi:MAG TPA: hypothetical protein VNO79_12305 [Actinomycetota bacterium]|nr:hypothetical protein [Actinomycetota bacterium]
MGLEVRNALEAAEALLLCLGVELGRDWGEVVLRYNDRGIHLLRFGRDYLKDALRELPLPDVDSAP